MGACMISSLLFKCALLAFLVCGVFAQDPSEGEKSILQDTPKLEFPRNISQYYQGSWHASNTTHPDSIGFTRKVGYTLFTMTNIVFTSEVDNVQGEMVLRDGIYSTDENIVYILDGVYFWQTGKLLLLANPLGPTNRPTYVNLTFDGNTTYEQAFKNAEHALIAGAQNLTIQEGSSCPFSLVLQLHPVPLSTPPNKNIMEAKEQTHDQPTYEMVGTFVSSPECKSVLNIKAASVPLSHFYSKWKKYIVMVSAASFVQIFVLVKQMEYTGTQAGASKVSLLTVGTQAVLDSYLCLIHLTAGILIDSLFSAFATAAFFQFITFSLFEMRYLLIILKARRPQAFAEGWDALRREFSLFYLRFYTLLVGGFAVVYYWSALFYVFLIAIYSFWIPQIICNAQRCARRSLMWEYILGMSVTRLIVPLYFFACPHNFISLEPNYNMAIFLVFYVSLQVFVLYLQEIAGPQFFIPKWLKPHKYDYSRPLYAHLTEDQRNCVICMCEVEFSDRHHMITPCDHVFHGRCLQQWLEFKEECPTCRRALPPV